MDRIDVRATPATAGWACEVTVTGSGSETRHAVRVSAVDLERLMPGAPDPGELVRASFAFLLEREAKESILRSFDLPVIGRYFPEYELEIRARLSRS
jgi:hypothetical protein